MSDLTVSIPTGGFNASGGVKTLVRLANAMAAKGWRVRIVVPDYAAEAPRDLALSITVVRLGTGRLPGMAGKGFYYLRLAACAAGGADLCLANFYVTAYCALLSKVWSRRTRVVYFLQGDEAVSHGALAEAGRLSRALRSLLARWSYRLPVRTICISHWLRDRIGRADSVVVTQGLDLSVFRPAPGPAAERRAAVVGTIGSRAPAKGYADVCRALALLAELPRPEIVVAALDDVPPPPAIVGRRVTPRSEPEMAAFYRACDVFVFASRSEGFGLPPLEAMACGCAVVTTACGGVSDFAQDGVNCLVVPPGDPRSLAGAIERLAGDPSLRQRLAEQGIKTAQGYERTEMVERFLEALVS